MRRSQSPQPPPPSRQPRTFLDWGVAVSSTTPTLRQARVRPARGGRIDVVMPNPAGGKGVYVMDLGAVGEVVSLSLHDRLLTERLLELPVVTPEEIRRTVRELAIEGAAGRAAMRAAAAAQAEDAATCLQMQLALIDRLLEAGGAERIDWRRSGAAGHALGRTLRARIAEVAPRVGASTDEILDLFERVAAAAAHVGMPGLPGESRDERQIARVGRLARDLRAWAGSGPDGVGHVEDAAAILADLAERTAGEARCAHATAREILDDVPGLVAAWRRGGQHRRRCAAPSPAPTGCSTAGSRSAPGGRPPRGSSGRPSARPSRRPGGSSRSSIPPTAGTSWPGPPRATSRANAAACASTRTGGPAS